MSARSWDDVEMPVSLSQRTHFLLDPSAMAAPMAPSHERRGKVFNDPVHGHIYLSGTACDIIGALAHLPPPLAGTSPVCPAQATPLS
jgi:hypothetical protein